MDLDEIIHIRVNGKQLKRFKDWCKKRGRVYTDVIREVMVAATERRLKIVDKDERKKK